MSVLLQGGAGLALVFLLGAVGVSSTARADSGIGKLNGKRVAILVTDGFEQVELEQPRKALDEAGAKTVVVSPNSGQVRAWNMTDWGERIPVDVTLADAKPEEFDALLLPGGVMNPDKLRMDTRAVKFAKAFFDEGKPVAAICHGPWLLVEAGVVRGRKLTSWPSLKTDVNNAGGNWVDEPVVVDGTLVTSRKPADIPEFNPKVIEDFAQGARKGARASAGSRK
jgi:protease I